MAAPVGGQIFSEILPYLEIGQGNKEEVEPVELIEAPDLLQKNLEEARKIAKESEVELVMEEISEELDNPNIIIKEQIPKPGITITKGSKIYIKYE